MFLCSNLRIEGNRAIYGIKSEKHDFESRTSKVVRERSNAYTRARYLIKKFIAGWYDIEFLCSNMRIKAKGAIYDINSKKCDFKCRDVRHKERSKLVPQISNAHTRACE